MMCMSPPQCLTIPFQWLIQLWPRAMSKRWQENEKLMPNFENLSQEQHEFNERLINKHRAKVKSLNL